MEALTPHGATSHGPAEPLPTWVSDVQADIKRPRCKECNELLGERFVVDHGVTYCAACASIGAE